MWGRRYAGLRDAAVPEARLTELGARRGETLARWLTTRKDAELALETFREAFGAKYPKALEKLDKDWKPLTAFYDFPAEH